ncbi:MAG TPA: hypothetical protein ENK57_20960 [Polyangiaceae bacterium]|nr:hypothetical protein [Polyangiaceae bacterium]
MTRARLLEILEHDEEIVVRLVEAGIIDDRVESLSPRDVEYALVARTLVRELDVNWAGVEVILSLRDQLRDTHRQIDELLGLLKKSVRREESDA